VRGLGDGPERAGTQVAAATAATTARAAATGGIRAAAATSAGDDDPAAAATTTGTGRVLIGGAVTPEAQRRTARGWTPEVPRFAIHTPRAVSTSPARRVQGRVGANSAGALTPGTGTISAISPTRAPDATRRKGDVGVLASTASTAAAGTSRGEQHATTGVGGIAAHNDRPLAATTTGRSRTAAGAALRAARKASHPSLEHAGTRCIVYGCAVLTLATNDDRERLTRYDVHRSRHNRAEPSGTAQTTQPVCARPTRAT
jgi:hypothetical protein